MGGRKPLSKCVIALIGPFKGVHKNFSKHIEELGGTVQKQIVHGTTHAVFSVSHWEKQSNEVKDALRRQKEGHDLKIVSLAWIDDCVNSKKMRKEAPYLWADLAPGPLRMASEELPATAEGQTLSAGPSAGPSAGTSKTSIPKKAAGPAKSAKGMMMEVFEQSTKPFENPAEMKAIEQRLRQEKAIRKQLEEETRREREQKDLEDRREDTKKLFAREATRARQDLMSNNYHIYADETGFRYDVTVTRVDIYKNRNERQIITMQLWESNPMPHVYVVNVRFAQTRTTPSNNLMCALGSPYEAAFRTFKEAFRELTGGDWDSRLSDSLDGVRANDKTLYRYELPVAGPRGVLSEKDLQRLLQEQSRLSRANQSASTVRAAGMAGSTKPKARELAMQANGPTVPAISRAVDLEGTETGLESTEKGDESTDLVNAEHGFEDLLRERDPGDELYADGDSGVGTEAEVQGNPRPVAPNRQPVWRQTSITADADTDSIAFARAGIPADGPGVNVAKERNHGPHINGIGSLSGKVNLGPSMLSKRKAPPNDTHDKPKRAKHDDGFASETEQANAQLLAEQETASHGTEMPGRD